MKKIIKLTESDLRKIVSKVLLEQDERENIKSIQRELIKRGYDVGRTGADGVYGTNTKNAVMKFQRDNNIRQTGYVGSITSKALGVSPMSGTKVNGNKNAEKTTSGGLKNQTLNTQSKKIDTAVKKQATSTTPTSNQGSCIALSKKECDKISSSSAVEISSGEEKRCSAYAIKCLSQYDSELGKGNAWDLFNSVKNGGTVKYNAFTSGEVNWNNIWSQLVKNKVTKDICQKHASQEDADKNVNSAVPNIVSNNIPQSPKLNLKTLQLGDIVGLYHKNSGNKGMAFCQRVLKRGLDNKGNVQDKDPFTFNSHVGFVGAIKNGIPIIIHNVHGHHMAVPATQMMSKNDEDMIVWVVSDNDVASAINNRKKVQPQKTTSFWDDINPFS